MDLKEQITKKFDKSNFKLVADHDIPNDWECIDPYIREFIIKLNQSEHINTLYSCEGHREKDDAYLFFNVDNIGWDIFFTKIIPELSYKFCFVNPKISKNALYQLEWIFNISDNEY